MEFELSEFEREMIVDTGLMVHSKIVKLLRSIDQ